jgi:L-ribulokinase
VHKDLFEAQKAMGSGFDALYQPRPGHIEVYQKLYRKYQRLGQFTENNA